MVMGLVIFIRVRVFYLYGKFGRMMCYKDQEVESLKRILKCDVCMGLKVMKGDFNRINIKVIDSKCESRSKRK